MIKKTEIEIPFFVYDKYSKQACFILLKNTQATKVEAIKIIATHKLSS